MTLPEPSDDGAVIGAVARELLGRAGLREPVRLLGVGVTNLVGRDSGQLSLFGPSGERRRRVQLNRALDEIRDRFGSRAVVRGNVDEAERAGLSLQIKRGESTDS